MNYSDFEKLFSVSRLQRYQNAVANNNHKALILYKYNIQLSQYLFTLISVFEVILRNKIDDCMQKNNASPDWLRDAVQNGGIFDTPQCRDCHKKVFEQWQKLHQKQTYSHDKLLAELNFGFWRYMLEPAQFNATGKILMQILPHHPKSTPTQHYNQKWFAKQLKNINIMRNRIAHHEPICFSFLSNSAHQNKHHINTQDTREIYHSILNLMAYMGINVSQLLHDLKHKNILTLCDKIDQL